MINEAYFSVAGYVATDPKGNYTRDGIRMVSMRVGWTPRRLDRATRDWVDQPSSFISVQCFRKVAENAALCLRRGDPIVLKGTLRVREYADQAGAKRISVDVVADTIGHDMSRGISSFSRPRSSQEPTVAEREQAMASGPDPLPGDRPAVLMPGQYGTNGVLRGPDSGRAEGGSAGQDVDDQDFDGDGDEIVDLEESAGSLTDATESAEPLPAMV